MRLARRRCPAWPILLLARAGVAPLPKHNAFSPFDPKFAAPVTRPYVAQILATRWQQYSDAAIQAHQRHPQTRACIRTQRAARALHHHARGCAGAAEVVRAVLEERERGRERLIQDVRRSTERDIARVFRSSFTRKLVELNRGEAMWCVLLVCCACIFTYHLSRHRPNLGAWPSRNISLWSCRPSRPSRARSPARHASPSLISAGPHPAQ